MIQKQVEATVDDARGQIVQVVSGSMWKQLNVIFRKKNSMGGGHYHKRTHEFFYVLKGVLLLNTQSINGKNNYNYKLQKGDCFEILPEEQHYMKFIEESTLIVLYSESFDKANIDTFVSVGLPKVQEVFQ
jgi:quercetin dioxygenase-like cupin family protein